MPVPGPVPGRRRRAARELERSRDFKFDAPPGGESLRLLL